jgi:general secretion pathway protein K
MKHPGLNLSTPKKSRGAALIIALMVVALVAVIGASMGIDYLITVKRASNQLIGEQAYSYSIAAESFAIKVLQMDLLNDAQKGGTRHDALDEFWNKDAPPFQTAEGAYGGKLYDLSGRFNINVLMNQKERMTAPPEKKNSEAILSVNEARFTRLLMSLSDDEGDFVVLPEQAIAIMVAVIDWLDVDNEPTGVDGAEDDFYAGIEERPPYRAANRAMVSPSELLLVAHMTPEIYKRLLPHITVWPMAPDQPAGGAGTGAGAATALSGGINVNTATENVLRSLNVEPGKLDGPPASREQVAPIIQQQQLEGGYAADNNFDSLFSAAGIPKIDAAGLTAASDFFLLDGHVTIGDVATHMQSVISRKNDKVQVILRSSGGL